MDHLDFYYIIFFHINLLLLIIVLLYSFYYYKLLLLLLLVYKYIYKIKLAIPIVITLYNLSIKSIITKKEQYN